MVKSLKAKDKGKITRAVRNLPIQMTAVSHQKQWRSERNTQQFQELKENNFQDGRTSKNTFQE